MGRCLQQMMLATVFILLQCVHYFQEAEGFGWLLCRKAKERADCHDTIHRKSQLQIVGYTSSVTVMWCVFGQVEPAGLSNSVAVRGWNYSRGDGHRIHSHQSDNHPCYESAAHCTRFRSSLSVTVSVHTLYVVCCFSLFFISERL